MVRARTALILLLGGSVAAISTSARAEGGCPPGQYPIGGQGVQGCAPIPGAASAPQPPRPTGRWIETWGAIVLSRSSGTVGVSTGKRREGEALDEARQRCGSRDNSACSRDFTYKNQCIALVDPSSSSSGGQVGVGTGPTETVAIAGATRVCKQGLNIDCTVSYTDCSKPIFEAF